MSNELDIAHKRHLNTWSLRWGNSHPTFKSTTWQCDEPRGWRTCVWSDDGSRWEYLSLDTDSLQSEWIMVNGSVDNKS